MDASDAAAGIFLLLFGIVGCALYGLIVCSMWRMVNEIVGFRFLISQALTDILLMIQFGIWPGIVILTQNEIINESWRWNIHIYLDFTWWAMVYHYTVIAWSRLAAVQWPNWFRTLPHGTSIMICAIPWFTGLLQSLVEHQFDWFTPLFYSPTRYGMHSDWEKYELSGTNTYYMVCNVILMVVPFPLYVLALAVLFQRQTSRNMQLRSKYSHAPISTSSYAAQQRQLSIETRLLVPCIINTILFVVGQVFISQCSKHGKWMNWAVMVVFATNSFVNPLLYLFFSSVIRKGVLSNCRKNFSLSAIYNDYEMRSSPRTSSIVMRLNHRDSTITSNLNCRLSISSKRCIRL
ncbi:G_PROTEIN_RECEP_F1_2 domain-containing protein [Caenorhabditis elegans]|uniref:G_PROTEIN_RECEP_F1_2 domain-containing protein n=1 Tax=Caenorhabditis elegans TaxID=6239 RepID=G1K0Z2_CAEEL|nr:G_PROTEIN_RECEP_F1_2 domain-containing protein [Caenorhabditis elegans]CCC42193.1 G_PROTEIN_RECEP_F1_2 domain-containing protein [Caenorhabditis elegans]|eukprot:NP_001256380.1 Uncharacterized protein CELE_R13H4.7 [Caenorhabditis elegans]